jgi:AmiR/NasT family two-component response regulator
MDAKGTLSDHDLRFVAETVWGAQGATAETLRALRTRDDLLDVALEDERLVDRLLGAEQAVVRVSPRLVFNVLLRRVSRDLNERPYTLERTPAETVVVFDAPRVRRFIAEPAIEAYLVDMLTSFVRTETVTVWVRRGERYRQRRFSTLNLEDMIELAGLVQGAEAPAIYRRIADIALFTSGIFPDFLRPHRDAAPHPRREQAIPRTVETYEEQGRRFYRLASRPAIGPEDRILASLAEEFSMARKSLELLSDRYLRWTRLSWFHTPG